MSPHPVSIKLWTKSRQLNIEFDDGSIFKLSCEYLRVYSPSAEVKGHAPGQSVLQLDKEKVNIKQIEPVGNYAVKLHFDDGHNTGLYSWDYLYELGKYQSKKWHKYITALTDAGYQRETNESIT